MRKKIYICDVDNTICDTICGDYENAQPYKDRIAKMNKLYDEGHTIIYRTARGQATGTDWIDFTRKQLKEWGAKFKLVGEKDYADYYIDDHNVLIETFFKGR